MEVRTLNSKVFIFFLVEDEEGEIRQNIGREAFAI